MICNYMMGWDCLTQTVTVMFIVLSGQAGQGRAGCCLTTSPRWRVQPLFCLQPSLSTAGQVWRLAGLESLENWELNITRLQGKVMFVR